MSETATWIIWLGIPFAGTLILNELRQQATYQHATIAIVISMTAYVVALSMDGHWADAWTPVAVMIGLCFSILSALVAHAIGKFRQF